MAGKQRERTATWTLRPTLVTLAAGLAVGGCTFLNPEFGLDTDGWGDDVYATDGLEGGTADAGLGGCLDVARCYVPPGPEWSGPVAISRVAADTGTSASCSGKFTEELWRGLYGPYGEPATCDACTCNPDTATLEACKDLGVSFHQYQDCTDPSSNVVPVDTAGACTALTNGTTPSSGYGEIEPGNAIGSCGATGGTVSPNGLDPAGVEGQVALCGGGKDLGGCPDLPGGRCIALPDGELDPRVCVYTEGAVSCPADFPVKEHMGQQLVDGRGCSDCACGVEGATCGVDLTLWAGEACNDQAPLGIVDGAQCGGVGQTIGSFSVSDPYFLEKGTCVADPSGGQPSGEVGFGTWITVCCTG